MGLLMGTKARQHLAGEQRQVIVVRQAAGVAHHQEVAHAAAIFAEIDDLGGDLIGRAAEHDGGIDQVLDAGAMHVDEAAIPGPAALAGLAAQDADIVLDGQIAGRIAERRKHDGRGARIGGDQLAPAARLLRQLGFELIARYGRKNLEEVFLEVTGGETV